MTIIEELKQENLCTHFILPLLKISKSSFVKSNFINSYLTHDRLSIIVVVHDMSLLSRKTLCHPNFICHKIENKDVAIIYEIPLKWLADTQLFCRGKYSLMSNQAKSMIQSYSGLEYKVRKGTKVITDARLLALERNPILLEAWIRELAVTTLDENDELLPIPPLESYRVF